MPHSKSYCVTSDGSLPQPHVEYKTVKSTGGSSWSSWFMLSVLGVGAIVFVVCINMFGGKRLFMVGVKPTDGLVLIVHQGQLEVYPKLEGSNNGILSQYTAFLAKDNLTLLTESLAKLFEGYPKEHGTAYSNCWLENPSPEKPCFFDSTWVTDLCTNNSSYGYEEQDGYYNPCFVMALEETESWTPLPTRSIPGHRDQGFLPVDCFIRNPEDLAVDIAVFPSKGFSHLFFPASKFNASRYLAPLVAVKLIGIRKGEKVVVDCSVITPNALILRNNGRIAITFKSE